MHYHAEFADPTAFDILVNTAALGLDGASATVRAALAAWRARPGLAERHRRAREGRVKRPKRS